MKRKTVFIKKALATIMIAATLLSACGTSEEATEEVTEEKGDIAEGAAEEKEDITEEAVEEKRDITLTLAVRGESAYDIDKELNERFAEETGIKIDMQVIPSDQFDNVISTKMAVGEGPDMFLGSTAMQMAKYNPEQYLADLSDEEWVSRYTESAKAASSFNGKIYALNMWASDAWGMLYDSTLFEKLNIKVPTNFDEFVEACEILKENGITPIYEPGKDTWLLPGYFKNTGAAVEAANPGAFEAINSGEKKFADYPEFLQAMENFKVLSDNGYFSEDVLSEAYGDGSAGAQAMASGKYGMYLVWSSFCLDIAKVDGGAPADKWKMFNSPLYGDCTIAESSTGGLAYYANKSSENLEAVKEYFNWRMKPENLEEFYKGRDDLAAVKPFTELADMPTNPALESYIEMGGGVVVDNLEAKVNYINGDLIGKTMQDVMTGSKTPEEAIKAIDADRAKTLEAFEAQ